MVESLKGRETLKKWMESSGMIFHIKRNIEEVMKFLETDSSRPSLSDDILKVWNRRANWYKECATYEFVIPPNFRFGHDIRIYWKNVESIWERILGFVFGKNQCVLDGQNPSFFVSLTNPDIKGLENLNEISCGADALEFRVDLLASYDPEYVCEQLACLRSLNKLPIIFTVRTISQGGHFPDDKGSEIIDFLNLAVRWCCDYIDVEINNLLPGFKSDLESLFFKRGNSKIVASFHDVKNEYSWYSETKPFKMRTMYSHLYPWCDIIKLIGVADSVKSNFEISKFIDDISKFGYDPKPIIALNMGKFGQLSRALNTYMTPVTHPLLPKSAAPGQLSIKEIHRLRFQIGMLEPKKFFLFGFPIAHSLSPSLHNSGFGALGLPHNFELNESSNIDDVKEQITRVVSQGTFGGAAITIPHKESLLSFVSSLTPSASKIQAINTIFMDKHGRLVGDNTDWIGIKRSLLETGTKASVAILLGAGGTARAACYALTKISSVIEIRLWNRTKAKSEILSKEFSKIKVCNWEDLVPENAQVIIVSTLPPIAQEICDWKALMSRGSSGVVLDLVYFPKITPLISFFSSSEFTIVYGIKVLIYQGIEQFKIWTGRNAPVLDMIKSIGEGAE